MARWDDENDPTIAGARPPAAVGSLIVLTAVASLIALLVDRGTIPFLELTQLAPDSVLHAQLWRVLSWTLLEPSALGLLFTCLMLYWFGGDLAREWGSRRFVVFYFGVGALGALATTACALGFAATRGHAYTGASTLSAALVLAWGLCFPTRVLRLFFVLPVSGRAMALLTIGGTALYALFAGFGRTAPTLFVLAATLAWLFRSTVGARITRWVRLAREDHERASLRERESKRRAAAAQLRELDRVEAADEDLPPLSKEMEEQIERALESARRERERR